MKMKLFTTAVIMLVCTQLSAQQNNDIKDAVSAFNSGKMDDGISKMWKVVQKDGTNDNWDMLVKMYDYRYDDAQKNSASIAIGQSMGANMKGPAECFIDMIKTCKKALLVSNSTSSSMLLRTYLVDYYPDTAVSKEARAQFSNAETFFGDKSYDSAIIFYKKALAIEPNYYQAALYTGDAYWYLNNMDSAEYYFKKEVTKYPDLLEPKKYLVDALGDEHKDDEAMKVCMEAILTYPDESMYLKLSDLFKRKNKTFNRHWIKRKADVNRIGFDQEKTDDKYWALYSNAKSDISEFCDKSGIITKSTSLTSSKYLEVYSWEKMLAAKNLPDDLAFAKKMQDAGYLDCYVFISQFQYDMYKQFKDFASKNRDRIKTYIDLYLTESK